MIIRGNEIPKSEKHDQNSNNSCGTSPKIMEIQIFTHTKKDKIKCKNNQNNAYKEMHDAQMHDNEASNA